jgi:hypothetical protein
MSVGGRSPQDQVFQTIVDFWTAQAVHAAARLGLADHLAERPRSVAELAASTGVPPPPWPGRYGRWPSPDCSASWRGGTA